MEFFAKEGDDAVFGGAFGLADLHGWGCFCWVAEGFERVRAKAQKEAKKGAQRVETAIRTAYSFAAGSQPKFSMRTKAHKLECVFNRSAVDENEIRADVAVAVIVLFAGQLVIEIPARQSLAGGWQVVNIHQQGIQLRAVPTGFFSPVITLKTGGVSNLPHSDFAAVCPACRP